MCGSISKPPSIKIRCPDRTRAFRRVSPSCQPIPHPRVMPPSSNIITDLAKKLPWPRKPEPNRPRSKPSSLTRSGSQYIGSTTTVEHNPYYTSASEPQQPPAPL